VAASLSVCPRGLVRVEDCDGERWAVSGEGGGSRAGECIHRSE
jgi:hypothetical protein